jgi:hypothetical protein
MSIIELPVKKNGFICTGHYTPEISLCVIDLDVLKGQSLNMSLIKTHPIISKYLTYSPRTGGNGNHLYYWVHTNELITNRAFKPNSKIGLSNFSKQLHIHEVDTRSEGGLVFAVGCKFDEHDHGYTVDLDLEIRHISLDEYNRILRVFVNLPQGTQKTLFSK